MSSQFSSFRVLGILKSLLQHHSSKSSILRCSAFLIVQLSHLYMTIGKTIALTRQTFVGKVMSLLLNMPSRLVITFLPRSKRLLISWLQSSSAVILEPKKIKSDTVQIVVNLRQSSANFLFVCVFGFCFVLFCFCYKNEKTIAGKQQHFVHKTIGALSTFVVTATSLNHLTDSMVFLAKDLQAKPFLGRSLNAL